MSTERKSGFFEFIRVKMGNEIKKINGLSSEKMNKIRNDHELLKQMLMHFEEFQLGLANEIVVNLFERVDYDIASRIDTLKEQLDSLKFSFNDELARIRKILKKRTLRLKIKSTNPVALAYNVPQYKKLILLNFKPRITFETNTDILKRSCVGLLTWYEVHRINSHIKFNQNYQIVAISANIDDVNDVCVLGNGNIVIVDSVKNTLTLFTSDFRQIATVCKVDSTKFRPTCVTSNCRSDIYVTEGSHKIYKLDKNLYKLSLFDGSIFNGPQEISNPNGICYHNRLLYVCSCYNSRVLIYTHDFKFRASYALDLHPLRIKIGKNTACVVGFKRIDETRVTHCICFYELPGFKLKRKYEKQSKIGLIFEIGSYFYEYSQRTIFCYNLDGNIHEMIPIGGLCDELNKHFDGITLINNKVALHMGKGHSIHQNQKFLLI